MDPPKYALTILHPWAWAIDAERKRYEVRTWPPPPWLREFVVHAGATYYEGDCLDYAGQIGQPTTDEWWLQLHATAGRLLCAVRIVRVEPPSHDSYFRWHLERTCDVQRIKVRGNRRLWRLPETSTSSPTATPSVAG